MSFLRTNFLRINYIIAASAVPAPQPPTAHECAVASPPSRGRQAPAPRASERSRRPDGRTDQRRDERAHGRAGGRTDRLADGRAGGRTHGRAAGRMGRGGGRAGGLTDGRKIFQTRKSINKYLKVKESFKNI